MNKVGRSRTLRDCEGKRHNRRAGDRRITKAGHRRAHWVNAESVVRAMAQKELTVGRQGFMCAGAENVVLC
jgi:hypothetical protein